MPFVEVYTREELTPDVRKRLAEALSDTMMTIEVGGPTESAKKIDWMWFHVLPADRWAVGGRFDETHVAGRQMALAKIYAPQGLMDAPLRQQAVKLVGKCLKKALGVGEGEDDTGIFIWCLEIPDGQWGTGEAIPTLHQTVDTLGGYVSQERRDVMKALYPQTR